MSVQETNSILRICEVHRVRLEQALSEIKPLLPFDAKKIEQLDNNMTFTLDSLTSRFAKLQDLLGSKVFDLVLIELGENTEGISMIDKANKLEKIGILESAEQWIALRRIRNHITHEYPDQPELTAKNLNEAIDQIDNLINCYENLKSRL